MALCLEALSARPAHSESPGSSEYAIKAALLVNILKFVSWNERNDRIVLCVSKGEELRQTFEQLAGELIESREIQVRFFNGEQLSADSCDVYFASGSEDAINPETLKNMSTSGVLTIGERGDFLHQGGVVNFYTDNNRVRFEINVAAAEKAGIKFSSKLLHLAKIYDGN